MDSTFICLLCGFNEGEMTGKHPRDRKTADIVICKNCGHIQMFPLLTDAEEKEEYANDMSVRFGDTAPGSDLDAMRLKFNEWTLAHADMYFDKLNNHRNVLELAAGYGFFIEELKRRPARKFNIEGLEIGAFRLKNYRGGVVHNVNLYSDPIPDNMLGKYDFIIAMHLLEHLSAPVDYLKKVKLLLCAGGQVLFEVPNVNSFLAELSPEYADFTYLYEHCSYYNADTIRLVFEKAGYKIMGIYTKEIYSIENHINWIRTGKPFIKYNQMFLPDQRLEWLNKIYKDKVSNDGKGYSLIIEAKPL